MKALLQPSRRATRAEQADSARGETVRAPRRSTAVRMARWRRGHGCADADARGRSRDPFGIGSRIGESPSWRTRLRRPGSCGAGLAALPGHVDQRQFLDEARAILAATALAAMVIAFLRVAFTDNYAVAEETIRGWLFAAVYLVAGRAILAIVADRFNRLGHGAPTLIVGAGQGGAPDRRRLLAHPELGLRPIGFVDPSRSRWRASQRAAGARVRGAAGGDRSRPGHRARDHQLFQRPLRRSARVSCGRCSG